MNIIYETTKERGATILMPSSMVDSMNPYGTRWLSCSRQRCAEAKWRAQVSEPPAQPLRPDRAGLPSRVTMN